MSTFDLRPTGHVALTAQFEGGAPASLHRHLGVARALARGLRPLVQAGPGAAAALAFLAAQVCETALKAFLLKHEPPEVLRAQGIRHDLGALWALAVRHGLAVDVSLTPAIELLVRLHKTPYPLRYADQETTQILCLPQSAGLADEVDALLRVVDGAL